MGKGIFNVTKEELFALLDEAWLKRDLPLPNDPGAYIMDMGKIVGTKGETAIKIITRPHTSQVLTAYPTKIDANDVSTAYEIFEGEVECPRCKDGGSGSIYKARLTPIRKTVYICDECDALWEEPNQISKIPFMDFGLYTEKHGYTYETTNIKKTNYYWHTQAEKASIIDTWRHAISTVATRIKNSLF